LPQAAEEERSLFRTPEGGEKKGDSLQLRVRRRKKKKRPEDKKKVKEENLNPTKGGGKNPLNIQKGGEGEEVQPYLELRKGKGFYHRGTAYTLYLGPRGKKAFLAEADEQKEKKFFTWGGCCDVDRREGGKERNRGGTRHEP